MDQFHFEIETFAENVHPLTQMPRNADWEQLLVAILRDHRAAVQKFLGQSPELVKLGAPEAHFIKEIAHWLYVGDTALHAAAAGYRVDIVQTLLAAGADPNTAQNHRRSRPLHYAADGSSTNENWDPKLQMKTLQLLLDAGAEINAPDKNGATALHRAVRTRCAAAVEYLLDRGSDPTAFNNPGSTPFHLAVQNTGRGGSGSPAAIDAQREIIRSFLARGLRPNLRDARGKTVFEWTRSAALKELLVG